MNDNSRPGSNPWQVDSPQRIWRFELTAPLTRGEDALAKRLDFRSGPSGGSLVLDSKQFKVYDPFGAWYGFADPNPSDPDVHGDRGFCVWMPDAVADGQRGRWEVLSMSGQARWIKFRLKAALGAGDGTQLIDTADVIESWDGTALGLASGGTDTLTLHNELGFEGDADGEGYAVRNDDGDWLIVQLECPAS